MLRHCCHFGNNVEATFDFVEATFDFVERTKFQNKTRSTVAVFGYKVEIVAGKMDGV